MLPRQPFVARQLWHMRRDSLGHRGYPDIVLLESQKQEPAPPGRANPEASGNWLNLTLPLRSTQWPLQQLRRNPGAPGAAYSRRCSPHSSAPEDGGCATQPCISQSTPIALRSSPPNPKRISRISEWSGRAARFSRKRSGSSADTARTLDRGSRPQQLPARKGPDRRSDRSG
jgi:hypothetical protein